MIYYIYTSSFSTESTIYCTCTSSDTIGCTIKQEVHNDKKWYFIKDTFKVVKNILYLLNIVESESSIKSWNRKKCVDKSSWSLSVTTTKKVNI